jgi:hypothetical protein
MIKYDQISSNLTERFFQMERKGKERGSDSGKLPNTGAAPLVSFAKLEAGSSNKLVSNYPHYSSLYDSSSRTGLSV